MVTFSLKSIHTQQRVYYQNKRVLLSLGMPKVVEGGETKESQSCVHK